MGVVFVMKSTRPLQAKIVNHSAGMGTPDPDTVRQRAKELAKIDGRTEINERDWVEAKRELHGSVSAVGYDGDEEMMRLVSERDMIASNLGHHVDNIGFDDSENAVEELIAEGMEEAVHDQMLRASEQGAAELEEEI